MPGEIGSHPGIPSPLHTRRDVCFGSEFLEMVCSKCVVLVIHVVVERIVSSLTRWECPSPPGKGTYVLESREDTLIA